MILLQSLNNLTNNESVESKITCLITELLKTDLTSLQGKLLTDVGLDSMKSIQLVVLLEEAYDIVFDDEELLLDNFNSIDSIKNMIEMKM